MARKKKPTSVKVGIFTYKIKYNSALIKEKSLSDGEQVSGYCDKHKKEIIIDPKESVQIQQDILLHEILHAIFEYVCDGIENPTEEHYVHFGTPGIIQVLRDNKEVREFIIDDSSNYED